MESILDAQTFARQQTDPNPDQNLNIDEATLGSSIESISPSFGFKKSKKDISSSPNIQIPATMQPGDTGTVDLRFSPRENFQKFEVLDNNDNFSLIDSAKFKPYD